MWRERCLLRDDDAHVQPTRESADVGREAALEALLEVHWPLNGGRRTRKGYKSELWSTHVREGRIVPRIADVSSAEEQALIGRYASNASTVWVIDDGDHFATPLLVHFHLMAHLVTPGGYYLIADTRLEQTCAAQRFVRGGHIPWGYCRNLLGPMGGPARAVHYLEWESAFFRANFAVDRSPERWVFTQHPGGWLRRKQHSALGPCHSAFSFRKRHVGRDRTWARSQADSVCPVCGVPFSPRSCTSIQSYTCVYRCGNAGVGRPPVCSGVRYTNARTV